MFMEVLAAKQAGNEQLANFYVERFPPDVRKAYDAWLAQRPFENPNADPHPFVPRLYEPRGTRSCGRDREGCKHAKDSAKRRQHFRSVSREHCPVCHSAFLRCASGKFEQQRVRSVAFAFAVAVFLFALVRTAMLPL